jgi:hypothetical protein
VTINKPDPATQSDSNIGITSNTQASASILNESSQVSLLLSHHHHHHHHVTPDNSAIANISELPFELHIHILSYLSPLSLPPLRLLNTLFTPIINQALLKYLPHHLKSLQSSIDYLSKRLDEERRALHSTLLREESLPGLREVDELRRYLRPATEVVNVMKCLLVLAPLQPLGAACSCASSSFVSSYTTSSMASVMPQSLSSPTSLSNLNGGGGGGGGAKAHPNLTHHHHHHYAYSHGLGHTLGHPYRPIVGNSAFGVPLITQRENAQLNGISDYWKHIHSLINQHGFKKWLLILTGGGSMKVTHRKAVEVDRLLMEFVKSVEAEMALEESTRTTTSSTPATGMGTTGTTETTETTLGEMSMGLTGNDAAAGPLPDTPPPTPQALQEAPNLLPDLQPVGNPIQLLQQQQLNPHPQHAFNAIPAAIEAWSQLPLRPLDTHPNPEVLLTCRRLYESLNQADGRRGSLATGAGTVAAATAVSTPVGQQLSIRLYQLLQLENGDASSSLSPSSISNSNNNNNNNNTNNPHEHLQNPFPIPIPLNVSVRLGNISRPASKFLNLFTAVSVTSTRIQPLEMELHRALEVLEGAEGMLKDLDRRN